jgi:site-specific DNA-methyltransferase (adenine-specific)
MRGVQLAPLCHLVPERALVTPYYDDGTCVIYQRDCRSFTLSGSADLVLSDPPYGETSLAWDSWPVGWVDALPVAPQMWCFTSLRTLLARHAAFDSWTLGQEVIWEKHNGSRFAADRFKRVHELAVHWYRGAWSDLTINPQTTPDATARSVLPKTTLRATHMGEIQRASYRSEDGGPRLMRSVIYCRSEHGRAEHPTQKPLGILEPLIAYSTNSGALVFDPMMGAGSTLVAAKRIGRQAVGIEIEERYCEIAAKRLAQEVLAL